MKNKISSKVAWLILSGIVLAIPVFIMAYIKYWNCIYNLFF